MFTDFDLRIGGRLNALAKGAIGTLLLLLGLFISAAFWLKTAYDQQLDFLFKPGGSHDLAEQVYLSFAPLRWIWASLPDGDGTLVGHVVSWPFALSVVVILGAVACVRRAYFEWDVVGAVLKARLLARREGPKQNQTIENSGDHAVVINYQIIEKRLADMQHGSTTLIAGIGAAIAATILAAVVTHWAGL